MIKKFKFKFKNKNEILALGLLVIITAVLTSYYNHTKLRIKNNYIEIMLNLYQ